VCVEIYIFSNLWAYKRS